MENKIINFSEAKEKILSKREVPVIEENPKMRELTNMLEEMGLNPKEAEKLYSNLVSQEASNLTLDEYERLFFGELFRW